MIVGRAKVVSSTPRSGSKRSMALMRPTVPVWMMSSIGSWLLRKRLAANLTRDTLSSISVPRT